jgi:hypothetical protein
MVRSVHLGSELGSDVLFINAHVKNSGEVDGSKGGLREIVRDSRAAVVVVATENSVDAYIAGAPKKPYGNANLVTMAEMLRLDPTLRSIADLPPGWTATRPGAGGRWVRQADPDV